MPLPFNKSLDLKLLKLVKENPILYNSSLPKYQDCNLREVVWQKIGDALNRPAMEFAAIQCQIHFGDYQEDKHKPGLIENLNEYLPEEYSSSWGAEKKILKLYRKHHGLHQLEAKHLYTTTARDLPTYGVTFFVVKEKQKGKKKMVPRLLGINAESILRLDEVTKEILQQWPLTHVKSYHAGKNDTFTLNFGDYSEKEYSVKTNDALRIRDILEGYIDIIRKRLCGPYETHVAESGAICQDSVESSRGHIMTHVENTSSKIVEHSIVGPSKIFSYEPGSKGAQGTQMMTVQQVIVTNQGFKKQQVITGEVPMRSDMSMDFVKKLNKMNSNAVKIVTFCTDPNKNNMKQAQTMLDAMDKEMPAIKNGVQEAAAKQESEEVRRKLLSQLDELCDAVAAAAENARSNDPDSEKVQENARKIADLTTQMYFSLDKGAMRRSDLLRRSRKSFIEDERVEANLRRASFIVAAAGASQAIESANEILQSNYNGPVLSNQELDELEISAGDKLGKLNAAVALFLTAHADPKNIDYSAAVNSMNTIKELLPELAKDAKALGQSQDSETRQELLDEIKALCDAARKVCMLTGCDDHGKIQEAANGYGEVSGRLVYIFGGRNPKVNADKENEIMELAKAVGDATTLLLVRANELTEAAAHTDGAGATALDEAGVLCADSAKDLLACAQLTAPTIHEPHCQSALTAAAEGLSSAAKQLALKWKPLVEQPARHQAGGDLTACTIELAKALDRLKNAYANLGNGDVDMEEVFEPSPEQAQRLQFIASVNTARGAMKQVHDELNKPIVPITLSSGQANELQDQVSNKLAQINASVASLLQTKYDPKNSDYATAELAVTTITDLMPETVTEMKSLISTCQDQRAQQAMLNDIRAWCNGIDDVFDSAASDELKDLEDASKKYAQASKKLSFVFGSRARKAREQLMLELFDLTHKKASQMVDDTNEMAETMGGASGGQLRDLGQAVEDSARALHATLMVTSPTLESSRCRSALAHSSAGLSAAVQRLAGGAAGLQDDETGCRVLAARLQAQRARLTLHAHHLGQALHAIRHTLQHAHHDTQIVENPIQKSQRLKFITSASAVREKAQEAERLLDQPIGDAKLDEQQARELESKVSQQLAEVNVAIASLINAKNDPQNPDYETADEAIDIVSDLLPKIMNNTKALSSTCKDEAARQAMIKDIRAWCDAIQLVCASAGEQDMTEFVDSAQAFADTSNRLSFAFNPRKITPNEQQVVQQCAAAVSAAELMCEATGGAADAADAADALAGLHGAALRVRARAVRAAARSLHATAQLTAPSIEKPHSQATLLATTDLLDDSAQHLVSDTAAHTDPLCKKLTEQLTDHKQHLDKALDGIRDTCKAASGVDNPIKKAQRLKFISSSAVAKDKLKNAEKLLVQPVTGPQPSEQHAKELQDKLSQKMAHVNAAIACLVQAQSDPQNPDYLTAEHSINTISETIPSIVTDAKALSSTCKDETSRQAMIKDTHAWLTATNAICASAENDNAEEFDKAAQQYINASNKLKFVVSSRKNPVKEQEVVQLCNAASQKSLQMVSEAQRVSDTVPPRAGAALEQRAARLQVTARALRTAAQLTAPSIQDRHCQNALLPTTDAVSAAARDLVSEAQRSHNPGLKILGEQLNTYDKELEITLEKIRGTCANERISEATLNAQRLKFVTSAATTQKKAQEFEKLLDHPTEEVKLTEQDSKNLQEKVSKAMAQINAALASLVNARSDIKNPDYATSEKYLETISEVMPDVIKDSKALSTTCKDEAARQAMIKHIRAWCDAVQLVCASAGHDDPKEFNESALNFSNVSQKLRFVVSARKSPVKEQQLIQLSSTVCDKAKQMAEESHGVAAHVTGAEGAALDERATALSDAAAALRTTTQLTASSTHEPTCRAALLSAADAVSASGRQLVRQTSLISHAKARCLAEELARYYDVMEKALTGLKQTTTTDDNRSRGVPPPVPVKRSSLSREAGAPASPRVRVVSHSNARRASQDWLDHMRRDATLDLQPMSPSALSVAEEEYRKQEEFAQIVDIADKFIHNAQQDLNKTYSTKIGVPILNEEQTDAIAKQMEQKMALVTTAVAKLVSINHPEAADYSSATHSAEKISELVPDVVKDGALLLNTRDDKSRKALHDKLSGLCEATRALLGTAKNDIEKINEAAVAFGDSSALLLYNVCKDIDPAQEKEVIARAKEIVSSASHLAVDSAGATRDARAAGRTAAAAGGLLYTAKLVGPTVHHQQCQNALITVSHELSAQLRNLGGSCRRQSSGATRVAEEPAFVHLEKQLERFRQELAAGQLVRRRIVEKILVEDTPLRQLAVQIAEGAQMRAECSTLPQNKRTEFLNYANKLREAIRALDVANTRSKRTPDDLNKRQDLDNAIQNLQEITLQARPTVGDKPQENVVDLTDFVKDTSSDAENLLKTTKKIKADQDKKEIDSIKEECQQIHLNAIHLLNQGGDQMNDDNLFDGIQEVDHFGQDCDTRVRRIKHAIDNIKEKNVKDTIQENSLPLVESSGLLKFATQSALTSAVNVALDKTRDELDDLEKRIDKLLLPSEGTETLEKLAAGDVSVCCSAARVVCAASGVTRGHAQLVTPALTAYVAALRAHGHHAPAQHRLKEHVSKLIGLLKSLTAMTGTRVALWQPPACPELAELTQQVIEELEKAPVAEQSGGDKTRVNVLKEADMPRLLLPVEHSSSARAVPASQLQALGDQVVSSCSLVLSSARSPALSASAPRAVVAALNLAATAREQHPPNSAQRKRTEEAAQEMCWVMYNLLKAAELVNREPGRVTASHRLHSAARQLNDAVNKVMRSVPGGNRLSRVCGEASRALLSLQTRQDDVTTAAGATSYTHCVRALQDQQEIIQKLKNDDSVSTEKFSNSLNDVTTAICNSADYAAQSAYLISISEQHEDMAKNGLVDVARLQKLTDATQDSCFKLACASNIDTARKEEGKVSQLTQELHQAIKEASSLTIDGSTKRELTECGLKVDLSATALNNAVCGSNASVDKVSTCAISLVDSIGALNSVLERPSLTPVADKLSAHTKDMVDDLRGASKKLVNNWQVLVEQVQSADADDKPKTWATYNKYRTSVLEASDSLFCKVQHHGEKSGLVERKEEPDAVKKSNKQIKLKFVSSTAATQSKIKEAEKLLDQPISEVKLTEQDSKNLQEKVSKAMAQINAALASLVNARSDVQNTDYITSEKSMESISEMIPILIKDTKTLSSTCKDETERQAMIKDIRAWCDAIKLVCASAGHDDPKEFNKSALKLANASQKLRFVVSARKSPVKEQQLIQLSSTVCDKAKQMAEESHGVAAHVTGAEGAALDERATALSDAAAALRTTTQLTASSTHEPTCRAALLSAADAVSASGRQLVRQTSLISHAKARCLAEELARYYDVMEKALTGLKQAVNSDDKRTRGTPPPVPVKRSSLSRNSVGLLSPSLEKAAEEEKRKQQEFAQILDIANKTIQSSEQDLIKIYYKKANDFDLSDDKTEAIKKIIEQKISLANTAAAKLVASNHSEAFDYTTASHSVKTLNKLIPEIVKETVEFSKSSDQKTERELKDKIQALCKVSRKLLETATSETEKLNEAAVTYGDTSAGLLYDICKEIDPAQEKEIITRVKEIVSGASQLAVSSAGAACGVRAAGRAAAAAGGLLYTAKLVGPTVHHQQCQSTLISASHELSAQLRNLADVSKQQSSDTKRTPEEPAYSRLEKQLECFRQELAAGKLVRRRVVEKILVEDTPLRHLAVQIAAGAQMRAECSTLPQNKRTDFINYANKLREAIRALDVANTRCKRMPHDLKKRQDLENVIQNLQIIALQSRPTFGDKPQDNIVDLTDFVKNTSLEAELLLETTKKRKPGQDKIELERIKEECHKININALKLLNPGDQNNGEGTSFDDIEEVDQFGQDCDNRVEIIKSSVKSIKEKKVKEVLQESSIPLIENCDLLRFATKSALATTQSVVLDATLNDLKDLEKRIDILLLPVEETKTTDKLAAGDVSVCCSAARVVCAASGVTRGHAQLVTPALTAYVAALRAHGHLAPAQHRLKEHVSKLIGLLKSLTAMTGTRVALWQPPACPELAEVTQQVIEELEKAPVAEQSGGDKTRVNVLKEADMPRLLLPVEHSSSARAVPASQLQALGDQVVSSCSLVLSSARSPALSASAPRAVVAALNLAATAREQHPPNSAQRKRTEEAAQEMCWAMYNLLKAAELVNREPGRVTASHRLHSAARQLYDAVNKVMRSVPGGNRLSRECGEASRALLSLQTRQDDVTTAAGATSYTHCVRALEDQQEIIHKLKTDKPFSRKEFADSLNYVTAAVCNSTECVGQSVYLISISEKHKDMAKEGLVDVNRLLKLTDATQESCYRIVRATEIEMAREEEGKVSQLTQELHQAIKEASSLTKDGSTKRELTECGFKVDLAGKALNNAVCDTNTCMDKVSTCAISLVDSIGALNSVLERPSLTPVADKLSAHTKDMVDDLRGASNKLISNTQALVESVNKAKDDDEPMTWVTYNTHRNSVIEAFEALLNKVQRNGEQAGLVEIKKEDEEEHDVPKKSYVQIQEEVVRKWLQRRPSQAGVKEAGEAALGNIIDIATKMTEDMKGQEKEDMVNLIEECKELLGECGKSFDSDKARCLQDRARELRRAVERGVVTRAVEDALLPEPFADFELFLDAEKDEDKRKFLLEKKIAELMSQLGRVTRTARLMARAAPAPAPELDRCSQQVQLLAPKLAIAAEERVAFPNDKVIIEKYRALLAQYAESLSLVQDLCDRAVDPLDYVQTAGETMSRMREESSQHNDPQLCAYTSGAIKRLANRVIVVSMSSPVARADPELRAALSEAQDKLAAAMPPAARASRLPDWKDTTAQILQTTGEVESALGGENIFKKLPDSDQPIYNAALNLHASVREWSGRDNEIVAVAKRMAVLMARLSEQMNTDRKRELIATSKSIVTESREVAAIAKKIANECNDVRIRTNLLQVCERIPTISGQLKMLTTVKGSTLGNQGGEEDREAMNMLVGNAQNLMSSVQEVVKAAASASVKIASQRGLKWVRKNY